MSRNTLEVVRSFFPDVTSVKDATKPLTIEVTKRDVANAAKRDHKQCAMALACKRSEELDGMIVSVKTAYTIKDNKAVRYIFPESVSREVVSFDRGGGFSPGTYQLTPAPPTRRIGAASRGPHSTTGQSRGKNRRIHYTDGIRTILGAAGH